MNIQINGIGSIEYSRHPRFGIMTIKVVETGEVPTPPRNYQVDLPVHARFRELERAIEAAEREICLAHGRSEAQCLSEAPSWVLEGITQGSFSGGRFGNHIGGKYAKPANGTTVFHVIYNSNLKLGEVKTRTGRFAMGTGHSYGETVEETVLESWKGFHRTQIRVTAQPSANAYGQDRTSNAFDQFTPSGGWEIWFAKAAEVLKSQEISHLAA